MPNILSNLIPKKIPLFGIWVVPSILTIILIAGSVGFVSYRNGQQAVNFVTFALREEITHRIVEYLTAVLKTPHQITRENQIELVSGVLNPDNKTAMQTTFLEVVKTFPTISSTYFGSEKGGIIGSGREGDLDSFYIYATENLLPGKFTKFGIDNQGEIQKLLSSVENYDARSRPWYKAAVNAGNAIWSDIYILTTGQDMAIAASRPVYDSENKLLGVTSVDLFLSQVASFLKFVKVSENGLTFIIERNGLLVASSTDEKPFLTNPQTDKLVRLSAEQSQTKLIRSAALFLEKQYTNFNDIPDHNLDLNYFLEGQRVFLQITPLKDAYGINWLIVVVLPEADFMGQINDTNRSTGIIIFGSVIGTIILSVITGGLIAHRIYNISEAAEALAAGKWNKALASSSRINELNILSRSFNRMSEQLHDSLMDLTNEIEERKAVEESLRESEDRYRTLVENVPTGVFRADRTGYFQAVNPALTRLLKIDPNQDFHQYSLQEVFADSREYQTFINQVILEGTNIQGEFKFVKTSGEHFWAEITARALSDHPKSSLPNPSRVKIIDGVLDDITDRKASEELTQKSLREKEVLLQELYHRTKNNMQVINSLLVMQANEVEDERINWIFQNMQNRIFAMSLVHEKLYKSQDLSSINLHDYVEDLARQLIFSYRLSSNEVALNLDVEEIAVTLDVAVPCGLILNELITNALKYAFPNQKKGLICINIRRTEDGFIEMMIKDDGIGIPNKAAFDTNRKMGLATVFSIAEHQLRGNVHIETEKGLKWIIRFPDNPYNARV